ncbi:hypothetical protein Tco_0571125 [Tanacetum coccineum]
MLVQYTKAFAGLVEYVIGTCPKEFTERDSKAPSIPLTRKKQVTFTDTCSTSTNNTQKHGVHQKTQPSNVQVIPSTGVSSSTRASGSKPRSNTKHNRILPAKSVNNKKVEDHPRTNKSVWTKVNRVNSSISSKHVVINSNSESVCKTCGTDHPLVSGLRLFKTRFRGMNGSWLVLSPVPATIYIPPTDKDLEILFQPMFDEYFDQSTDSEQVPTATSIRCRPQTSASLFFLNVIAAGPTIEDTSITQADLHPPVNPVVGEPSSAQSTSRDVSLAEPNQCNPGSLEENQKKLSNQISKHSLASADVPSSVTVTTDTTSTLPPPPPPLQKTYRSIDIFWEKVKDQKSRMHH